MPYIGNTPALDYISYAVQNFTVTAGTTVYTLDYSVSNENDIRLVLNNVIQRPGASYAYSATGTTLTLTSATNAGDTMYAVFIGRAVQTVVPPASSVTNTMLSPSVITGQTAETSVADGDLVLIYDDSATALRKMTKANLFSNINNAPAFAAYMSTDQSVADNTEVKAQINTEVIDTNNCYDPTTNYRFTPNVAGKYIIGAITRQSNFTAGRASITVKFNGAVQSSGFIAETGDSGNYSGYGISKIFTFNGSTDYVECFFYQNSGTSKSFQGDNYGTYFWGFRLIGV